MMKSKNALIIFTRVPIPGKTKTRLMPFLTGQECAELHEAFLKDIYHKSLDVDADLFVFYTPEDQESKLKKILNAEIQCLPQFGNDLGSRMRNAIAVTLLLGYEKSVLIGSDCPQIHVDALKQSFSHLDDKDVVIHPTVDGGYYLIGMKENHDTIWNIKRYGTNTVIYDTLEFMKTEHLTTAIGQMYYDIDDKNDLYRLYLDIQSGIIDNCQETKKYLFSSLRDKLKKEGAL